MLRIITWLLVTMLSSGCVAIRGPKSWRYWELHSEAERATQPTILLDLEKEPWPLPVPLVLWTIGSGDYMLTLDFVTSTVVYQQFDSIQYQIRTTENQLLVNGTLALLNGKVSKTPFQSSVPSLPDAYLIRCATPTRIPLGNQCQPLKGTFLIYALDRNGQPVRLPIDDVPLSYIKAGISTLF